MIVSPFICQTCYKLILQRDNNRACYCGLFGCQPKRSDQQCANFVRQLCLWIPTWSSALFAPADLQRNVDELKTWFEKKVSFKRVYHGGKPNRINPFFYDFETSLVRPCGTASSSSCERNPCLLAYSKSFACKICRARNKRERTVPIGMPAIAAISS